MKYSGHRKLLCEFSKLSKLNAFNLLGYYTNTDASILVYKFRPEKTGFNMYAEYTQLQLTFLALHSWELPSFRMKNWGKKTCKVHHCFTSRASLYAIIEI